MRVVTDCCPGKSYGVPQLKKIGDGWDLNIFIDAFTRLQRTRKYITCKMLSIMSSNLGLLSLPIRVIPS